MSSHDCAAWSRNSRTRHALTTAARLQASCSRGADIRQLLAKAEQLDLCFLVDATGGMRVGACLSTWQACRMFRL